MKRLIIILLTSFNILGNIYADNPDLKESFSCVVKYGSVIDTVWDNVKVST